MSRKYHCMLLLSRSGSQILICTSWNNSSIITLATRLKRRDKMKLSPRELDHLMLLQAGMLAQKWLARDNRLLYPKVVAPDHSCGDGTGS